ncbi:putative uncharacterized protein GUCA1ANB [Motacilla alba alba]|uniref:putative uncharacterized protein GUCA1ANB n=1 Tax=Motacilla alba alba TaxID=1094192 RepID=UPI0018D59D27|nr:putative uncharacterized protein GUCA1ANB [Motacilla alba alba]
MAPEPCQPALATLQCWLLPAPQAVPPSRASLLRKPPRWLNHQKPLAKPRRAKGMEEAKAEPEITQPAPRARSRPPPAAPLGSGFVPVVVHTGGRALSSFQFVFYRPGWPNSLAPFCTAQKPFCGFRFQPGTAHGRRRLDLPSSDTRKWRSFHGPKP